MKPTLLFIAILILFNSCKDKEDKISFDEFENLYKQGEVAQIDIISRSYSSGGSYAIIHLNNSSEKYRLDISDVNDFTIQLKTLAEKLDLKTRPPFTLGERPSSTQIFLSWSIIIVPLITLILLIISVVSLMKSEFKNGIDKILWLAIILFIPLIGSLLFLVWGRKLRLINQSIG